MMPLAIGQDLGQGVTVKDIIPQTRTTCLADKIGAQNKRVGKTSRSGPERSTRILAPNRSVSEQTLE